MKKADKLTVIAFASLAVAILSVFTTIIGYTNARGYHRDYTLIDFFSNEGNGFDRFVSSEYRGEIILDINIGTVQTLAVIGVLAFVFAIMGLINISKQKENKTSFLLTVLGLIGIMIPSLVILICILVLGDNYEGTISCGIFPIVSPIAMITCIAATTKMHRKNLEYKEKLKEAEGLIFKGGDL